MTDEAAGKLTAAIIRLADVLATTKEGNEKERSPYDPLKEKAREETLSQTPGAGVRVRARKSGSGVRTAFAKPTVEEVAAHIREKGYTFDADEFWHFYDSKGWLIGNHVMRSWQSACVTWQKRCNRAARREAARQAHIDARIDERERRRNGESLDRLRESQAAALHSKAVNSLTEDDWQLCLEAGCRHCAGCECEKGCELPPDHRLNDRPCRPEECPYFEEGGVA